MLVIFQDDSSSIISFTSSIHSLPNDSPCSSNRGRKDDVETKSTLMSSQDKDIFSRKWEAMASNPANCDSMRANNIIEVLVQWLHCDEVNQYD